MRKVFLLSAIFFTGVLFSCKKDGALVPDFDKNGNSIIFTDTFSLESTLVREDSLRTDLAIYHLLGLYNDPFFGTKSSSIYTQLTLTGSNVDFGVSPTLDSVVLTLKYQGLYGDTTTPMSVDVYELTTELSSSTDYYSNSYIAHDVTPLASKTFVPNATDSVSIAFDTIVREAHLRINLGSTFGNKIIAGDINGTNDLVDNTTFQQYIKGLYITTSDSVTSTSLLPGDGSIAYFDMNSAISTVTVYYNDTSNYEFTINSGTVKYSRFAHDYTGTDIDKHLTNNPLRDTTVSYISTMAGVKTKLIIPNIKDIIKDGNVVINKAELEIPIEIGSEGSFDEALPTIAVVGIDESGNSVFIPDFFEGLSYYGGSLDVPTNTYTFNVTQYLHQLVYDTPVDYGMYLISSGSSITANRSVIGSWHNNSSKIKLNITYSKLQ
jgi:hypothetical protein